MIKVLIIDDQEESIRDIRKRLDAEQSVTTKWCGFEQAEEEIRLFLPHVVVLDLLTDTPDGQSSVEESSVIRDFIWNSRFCPVIVYSAQPERFPENHLKHPFVRTVKKGSDSVDELVAKLNDIEPHIRALADMEDSIRARLADAMQHVAPYAIEAHTDPNDVRETILRMGRRRLAAQMDDVMFGEKSTLKSWEMYLCPPVSTDLQLGDVLRETSTEESQPKFFRLVLSPSCDMVRAGRRSPKISKVLLARCCSVTKALERLGLAETKDLKLREPSRLNLSQGYIDHLIHLPSLSGRIPTMAADVKDLELVSINRIAPHQNIDSNSQQFSRVASIDSPFREAIMWSYVRTAGRPGLPDRDTGAWSREIIAARRNG